MRNLSPSGMLLGGSIRWDGHREFGREEETSEQKRQAWVMVEGT
jgi:hypothetical protein